MEWTRGISSINLLFSIILLCGGNPSFFAKKGKQASTGCTQQDRNDQPRPSIDPIRGGHTKCD